MMRVVRAIDRRRLLAGAAMFVVGCVTSARSAAAQDATPAPKTGLATKAQRWVPAGRRLTKLDLNSATSRQFIDVPGVGPAQARRFVGFRPYESIVDFRERVGATDGAERVATWESWLYVPVDPNLADVPTLMQLPGVTEDVAIALAAARPYPGVAVFLEALSAVTMAPADLALAAQYLALPLPLPIAEATPAS